MPFIRRYTAFPPVSELLDIESINIIDLAPPASISGVGTGVVAIVGEFLKGDVNKPTEVVSSQDLSEKFGTWSKYSNPGGPRPVPGILPVHYDGNGFLAIRNKKFFRLVIVNVEQKVTTCTIGRTDAETKKIKLPAGSRIRWIRDGVDNFFATLEDVEIAGGEGKTLVKLRRVSGTDTTAGISNIYSVFDKPLEGTWTVSTFAFPIDDITEAEMDAYYGDGLNTLLKEESPMNEVNIVFCGRHTAAVGLSGKQHVIDASSAGRGRIFIYSPPIGTSKIVAQGDTGVGVGNIGRHDRVFYCYPGIKTNVPEIAKTGIAETGDIEWTSDASLASVLSQLAPERNPGQKTDFLLHILGIETGVGILTMADYKIFKAKGICAPRMDRVLGAQFQSGVTSVDPTIYPELKNIARRRMADFIQDSITVRLARFQKDLMMETNKRLIQTEIEAFLEELLSPANPTAQRIAGYSIDPKSANTPDLEARGIFIILIKVRTLATFDSIVLQAEIGEGVSVKEVGG